MTCSYTTRCPVVCLIKSSRAIETSCLPSQVIVRTRSTQFNRHTAEWGISTDRGNRTIFSKPRGVVMTIRVRTGRVLAWKTRFACHQPKCVSVLSCLTFIAKALTRMRLEMTPLTWQTTIVGSVILPWWTGSALRRTNGI